LVIIRAHGVSPSVKKRLKKRGAILIDGTCPNVLVIHRLAERLEKEGNQVIIIGNKDHPEIVGIMGNLKKGIVINSLEEVSKLDNDQKQIVIISQTTEEIEKFKKLVKALKSKFKNVRVHNTICDATHERQEGALSVAKKSDCMIVVGGKHSSNTTHLADICKKIVKTYHIETAEEIVKNWFKNVKIVGVTAGASTPGYIVDSVLLKLKEIYPSVLREILKNSFELVGSLNGPCLKPLS